MRDYGVVMLQVKFNYWNKILNQVLEDDLYIDEKENIYGYEHEPHLTLLYGLHENIDHDAVIDYLHTIKPIEIELKKISYFTNDNFDVLKIECSPDNLLEYRDYLMNNFKNTQMFDEFSPHITIAYLKKGTAEKYCKDIDNIQLKTTEVKYSSPVGHKQYIEL